MRGGLGGRMHAMLRNLVHAPRRRFLVEAVKMGEGARAFTDGVAFLNGFDDVGFGKQNRVVERTAAGELRGNRRGEGAARAVGMFGANVIAAQCQRFGTVEKKVDGFVHMPALDYHGASATLHQLTRGSFHSA